MPMLRQEMVDNGHTAESPPRLHENIHPSLVPNETWKRPRQNGSSNGPHMDAYYVCHLCSETTCLFDPHASVHPYYTEGPPGFNSTKQLEAHLMEMHCLPFPTPPPPPAPVPALEAAPTAAPAPAPPAPPAAEAAVRKTERQLAKERADAEKAKEKSETAISLGSAGAARVGGGHGHVQLQVRSVRQVSAARYVVEFEQPDVPATNISDKMLESLRRSVGRQGCNWDGKVEAMMLKYNGDDDDATTAAAAAAAAAAAPRRAGGAGGPDPPFGRHERRRARHVAGDLLAGAGEPSAAGAAGTMPSAEELMAAMGGGSDADSPAMRGPRCR